MHMVHPSTPVGDDNSLAEESGRYIADSIMRSADHAGLSSDELAFILDEAIKRATSSLREAVDAAGDLVEREDDPCIGQAHMALVDYEAAIRRVRNSLKYRVKP